MRRFEHPAQLATAVGEEWGPGPWLRVDQERVDRFAAATGDDQWIHVDPVRAAAGPFGTTIAHGYLTLALLPVLIRDLYAVDGIGVRVNYGLDRVRFPAPVTVPSAVRAGARLQSVGETGGGYQVVLAVTVHSDTAVKPVCVAEAVARLYPDGA
jgi:acyl dehydratase